jgi:DivIVA domain-containing protein
MERFEDPMAIPLDNGSDQNALNRFFEPEQALPTFTQALRGYHKEEVDQYLRELRDTREEEAQARADAEAEVRHLRARVSSLERSLQDETPHTIEALGERMVVILRNAEEGAKETVTRAQEEADRLCREARERADAFVRQASLRSNQAAEELKSARLEAEDLIQRAESEANERATGMINMAEAQASAHLAGAQRRATELREQTEADQRRAETEASAHLAEAERRGADIRAEVQAERRQAEEAIQTIQERAEDELERLAAHRREVLDSLGDVQGTIGRILDRQWSEPEAELRGEAHATAPDAIAAEPETAEREVEDRTELPTEEHRFEEGHFFPAPPTAADEQPDDDDYPVEQVRVIDVEEQEPPEQL